MTTNEQVNAHLDEVTVRMLTWKPTVTRTVALIIAGSFIRDRIQWSDNIDLGFVGAKDRNAIGMAWRLLYRAGIIEPLRQFKRSKVGASRGRRVFKYRLVSEARAESFIRANGGVPLDVKTGQFVLALAEAPEQ